MDYSARSRKVRGRFVRANALPNIHTPDNPRCGSGAGELSTTHRHSSGPPFAEPGRSRIMAVRKTLSHDTKTREKIQTSQLINRLQDNAFGKVELSSGQLKSIEILLKKTLPDLSAVTIDGTGEEGAIVHEIVLRGVGAG